MSREETLVHLRYCRELAERGEPLTMEELRRYNELRAAEIARAERRREGSLQLPLGEVA